MAALLGKLFPALARPASRREELTELLQESVGDKASFDSHEGALLQNFPRADIFAVSLNDSFDDIIQQMSAANHSRVPVYRDTLDDAVGIIHIKDLFAHLPAGNNPPIDQLLRPALFISPAIRLLDLLHEMRLRRRHLALVVDEFGGVDGLITIEDLVEQIVGEIEDEHDKTTTPRFEIKDDGTAIADARLQVEDLEAMVGELLDDDERDEVDTVGGLVFALAGRVPSRGEVVRHRTGIQFEILDGDPRRITLLKIRGLPRAVAKQDQD